MELILIIREFDTGWFAKAGNVEEIVAMLTKIANANVSEIKKRSENARALAESKHSKKIILNKFNALFKN